MKEKIKRNNGKNKRKGKKKRKKGRKRKKKKMKREDKEKGEGEGRRKERGERGGEMKKSRSPLGETIQQVKTDNPAPRSSEPQVNSSNDRELRSCTDPCHDD